MAFNIIELIYRAKDETARATTSVQKNLLRVGAAATKVATGYAAILGAVATFAGGALTSAVRRAISDLDRLDKAAGAIGLNVERFQELEFAARKSGVGADTFARALATMSGRLVEAANGGGRLLTGLNQLRQLGLGVNIFEPGTRSLKELDEVVIDFVKKLGQVEDQQLRTSIAVRAFNVQGIGMNNIVNQTAGSIEELIAEVREFGGVIDETTVKQGAALNAELDTFTHITSQNYKRALISLGPALVSVSQWMAELAVEAGKVYDKLIPLWQLQPLQMVDRLEEGRELLGLMLDEADKTQAKIDKLKESEATINIQRFFKEEQLPDLELKLARETLRAEEFAAALAKAHAIVNSMNENPLVTPEMQALRDELERAALGERNLQAHTIALNQQFRLLGQDSEIAAKKLEALFDLENTVRASVTKSELVAREQIENIVDAARRGRVVLVAELEKMNLDGTALAENLSSAYDVFGAKLGEVDREFAEVTQTGIDKLEALIAGWEADELKLRVSITTTGLEQFVAARVSVDQEFSKLRKTLEDSDADEETKKRGRLALAGRHAAEIEAIESDAGRALIEIREEVALAGLDEEERAKEVQLRSLDRWFTDRYALVQAGLLDESALWDAYDQQQQEIADNSNEWLQAFSVDIEEFGVQALKGLGDQTADTFADIITGATSAKEGFADLGASIVAMGARMAAQIVVAKALEAVVRSVSPSQNAPTTPEKRNALAAEKMKIASSKHDEAAADMLRASEQMIEAANRMPTSVGATPTAAPPGSGGGFSVKDLLNSQNNSAAQQGDAASAQVDAADTSLGAALTTLSGAQTFSGSTGVFQTATSAFVQGLGSILSSTDASRATASIIGIIGSLAGSAAEGGITTTGGLINIHPQEAIIPLDRLEGGVGGVNVTQTIIFEGGGGVRSDTDSGPGERNAEVAAFFESRTREIIEEERRPGGILDSFAG